MSQDPAPEAEDARRTSAAADSTRRAPATMELLPPNQALALVIEGAKTLAPRRVPLLEACGLRLASEVRSDRPYPPFPRAMMDGYAVRRADAGTMVRVVGEVAAGQAAEQRVAPGHCVAIMTGAPCPPGTEAVVPREDTQRKGNLVRLPDAIAAGSHIASRGSECEGDAAVLRPGDAVTPLAVAVLASLGLEAVCVFPRPSLAIITTGDELTLPGQTPSAAQIRDSNGPMLAALAAQMGLDAPLVLHADDRGDAIAERIEQAAGTDVLLLTGGVSAGHFDLVPEVLGRLGATIVFHRVRQKPGKPMLFAHRREQLVFGLPGNPLACHLGFNRYVAAAIRKMRGEPPLAGRLCGVLAGPIRRDGERTYYCLGRAEPDADQGWRIHPLAGRSSADVFTPCQANCYVVVPPGKGELQAGAEAVFEWVVGDGA